MMMKEEFNKNLKKKSNLIKFENDGNIKLKGK